MRLVKIIIGELVVLAASVLIFRSLWMMLDQLYGYAYLEVMLAVGVVVTVLGLILLNHEVKCELEDNRKKNKK